MVGQLWGFVALGVCVGIFSGMLGLGGGVIVVPALVFVCGFGQKAAQGTALAVMVPMALVGVLRYWRNPEVELRGTVIALISLGAIVGTLFGTELAARLPAATLRKLFAVFLVIVGVRMFAAPTRSGKASGETLPADPQGASSVEHGDTDDAAAQR